MAGERKLWLDFGKGCSMVLVLLFHCEMYSPFGDTSLSSLFTLFRMPFFFFLSGFLFTADPQHFSLRRKLKQILRGIVWTYLLFATAITIPKYLISGEPLSEGFENLLLGYASWFVVALGGSQVLFALLLRWCKRKWVYVLFMIASLLLGWGEKALGMGRLPYCFDSTLVVNFYFGLGMFYRWNETRVNKRLKDSWSNLVLLAVVFFVLTWFDRCYLHTCEALFNVLDFTNFPLAVAYSLIGIAMMTIFSKKFCQPRWIRFVGRNSLVFYYLNGGIAHAMVVLLSAVGLTALFQQAAYPSAMRYVFLFFLLLCVALTISLIAWAIRRYAPLLIGDKESFNRMAVRLGLSIRF